ncbi:MAG: 50S ribosome-binding GTPase [Nitrospiraceae bacterium]|jgi:tRNA modification GTPase|nr:50S ribosome-binding GTPase [Nitrospiraceae bacterium]
MEPVVAPVTVLIPQPVGILRLSGDSLSDRIRPLFPSLPSTLEHRRIYRATAFEAGSPVDECLLLFFKGPRSYTGEDVIEIQAHGNPHNIRHLLSLLHSHGIRLAKPGEFSMRAYQNRKISLLKAESLHRMISAPSYSDFREAHHHYASSESHPLYGIQEEFLNLLALFFTLLDHPEGEEEALSDLSPSILQNRLQTLDRSISEIITLTAKTKKHFNGFSVLISGHPNSGKSSLFNRILKENRAIVSPLPGTTRDLLEGRLSFPFGDLVLLDSAGIRSSEDTIEQEGIRRTRRSLSRVDCVLWIASPEFPNPPASLHFQKGVPVFLLWNKVDLSLPPDPSPYDYLVSARTRRGLSSLCDRLRNLAENYYSSLPPGSSSLDSDRQINILRHLRSAIRNSRSFLDSGRIDVALSALEEGRRVLEDGVGTVPASDIYDRVFNLFCLGK